MATVTLRPSADTSDVGWGRINSGLGGYQNVNSAVAPDDFSLGVFATVGGELSLWEVPDDVPAGKVSISVEVFARATSGGADTEHFSIACKSGATLSAPETKNVAAGAGVWTTFSTVFATNPAGGAWTPATANAMKIGVSENSVPVNSVIVDQVYAVVTYSDPVVASFPVNPTQNFNQLLHRQSKEGTVRNG